MYRMIERGAWATAIVTMLGFTAYFAGCKAPPEAPDKLNELSTYLFVHFEDEEPEELALGLDNLYTYFQDEVDLTLGYNDRAFTVDVLTEEFTEGISHPGRDPESQTPVGLVAPTLYTPTDHTAVIVLDDQTPVEPNSPDLYDRVFQEPTDPSCFHDRSCSIEVMRTMNDIYKSNTFMSIPYDMHKDYRWVEMGEAGSGLWAVLARSWCEEEAFGDDGNTEINQSFSIDVFLPDDTDGIRYMALWSESTIEGAGEDVIAASVKLGMNQMFNATDTWLDDNL